MNQPHKPPQTNQTKTNPQTTPPPTTLHLTGITCTNCIQQTQTTLNQIKTITHTTIQTTPPTAQIHWQPNTNTTQQTQTAIQALKQIGIHATPQKQPKKTTWKNPKTTLTTSTIALLYLITTQTLLPEPHRHTWHPWLAFTIALLIQTYCGAPYYTNAWRQLKQRRANMHTLITIGTTAALTHTLYNLLHNTGAHLYHIEPVAILTLITLGHHIENRLTKKTANTLQTLLQHTPQHATQILPDNTTKQTPTNQIQPGDHILIHPGQQIPIDGTILHGHTTCDESMLTGEPHPIEKTPNQPVYAGTLNHTGQLTIKTTTTHTKTALHQIITTIQNTQNNRAKIQKRADRISAHFVPITLLIALLTLLLWTLAPDQAHALHNTLAPYLLQPPQPPGAHPPPLIQAIAVLIIACPCAMGIATPIALTAGANAAAQRGILIRHSAPLENTPKITQTLLDKTGTLTQGKPQILHIHHTNNPTPQQKQQTLTHLTQLTTPSNHPLARAIHQHLKKTTHPKPNPYTHWQEHPGKGIQATQTNPNPPHQTTIHKLGNPTWTTPPQHNPPTLPKTIQQHIQNGATHLTHTQNNQPTTHITLQDQLKPHAQQLIQTLTKQKLKPTILTGDQPQTAHHIAQQLNLPPTTIHPTQTPQQKTHYIRQQQQKGKTICYIGDGINDAPALEQADIGIAVSQASDIAKKTADILLLKNDLRAIPQALDIARATITTVKQNLFWALFYNAAAIPLAALGFLSPILCAAAMAASDIIVIANALRLRHRHF